MLGAQGGETLLDLVERGVSAAAAPIHLEGGSVLVTGNGRDLEHDDLAPLARHLVQDPRPFLLVLAVESEPEETYAALEALLRRHRSVLRRYEGGEVLDGPLTVVLVGQSPLATMEAQRSRYAFAGGGPETLTRRPSTALVPLVRVRYDDLLAWAGEGELPDEERLALQAAAARAHGQQRTFVVHGAPQERPVWEALLIGGVDRIEVGPSDGREAKALARFLGRRGER